MSSSGHSKWTGVLTASLLAVSTLLAYQNCGEITESARFPSNAATLVDYPYDVRAEVVGFMSCEGLTPSQYDPEKFFNIAIGALPGSTRGGIRFSDAFRSEIISKRLNANQVADLIADDPDASGVRLQLSLRQEQALGVEGPVRLSGTTSGTGFRTFFPNLDGLVPQLHTLAQASGSQRISQSGGASFRATLSFVEGVVTPGAGGSLGSLLLDPVGIVLGFQLPNATNGIQLAKPFEPRRVHGMIMEPNGFRNAVNPYGAGSVPGPARVLSDGFNQRSAAVGRTASSVTEMRCPPEGQYRIVENRPWANTGGPASAGYVFQGGTATQLNNCNPNGTLPDGSADAQRAYQAANFLLNGPSGTGFWTIDQQNRCIIANNSAAPTSSSNGSCYPQVHAPSSTARVDWTFNGSGGGLTPHYFSVCYLP